MRFFSYKGSQFLTIANLDAAGGAAVVCPAGTRFIVIHANVEAAGGNVWVNPNAVVPSATNSAKIPGGTSMTIHGYNKNILIKNAVAGNCSVLVMFYGP